MKQSPCKDCPRKGCGAYHDKCKPYQDWKKQNERKFEPTRHIWVDDNTFGHGVPRAFRRRKK